MQREYDVVVIGAGPAGGAAASACLDAGQSVAMVDARGFGGVCPLRGCNPKKVLLGAAAVKDEADHLAGKGLPATGPLDWAELMAFKRTFTDNLAESIRDHYASQGAATFEGHARFTGPDRVEVGDATLAGRHIVLAPGMVPRPLPEPGAELLATSDDFLELDAMPPRIVFVGGGFISFEFAHTAARAGAKCVIVHRSKTPLKHFDPDMVQVMLDASRQAGIEVHLEAPLHSVEKRGGSLLVRAGEDGEQGIPCDLAVHGAGRVPDLDGLGLDAAGIEAGPKGVTVNEYLQSVSNERVYAAGDGAATPFALTPSADVQGKACAHNILSGNERTVDYKGIPQVVFSLPEVCAVGAAEAALRKQGIAFTKREGDLSDSLPWKRRNMDHAAYKLLIDKTRDVILGAHMVGHGAGEMANLFAMAVRLEIPVSRLKTMLWAYPTTLYYFQKMI